MIPDAYIFDAIRTPRGKGKPTGSLHEVKPISLVVGLLQALQDRNQFASQDVDDIVLGCVTPIEEQGADIAKTAAIAAGWHDDIGGVTLNRFCASGLESINMAAMKIRSGWEQMIVAGGIESMSRVRMGSDGGAWMLDPETSMSTGFVPQGLGADMIATIDGYDRIALDNFARRSHQLASQAWQRGAFERSIVPVRDRNDLLILDHDETIRGNCSVKDLAKLTPVFTSLGKRGFDRILCQRYPQIERVQHQHTAGNASGIVDGAALVLLGNQVIADKYQLTPRAKVIATAVVGTDPVIMLTGPAPAAEKALRIAGLSCEDIDLFEVNEAFSAVVLRFMTELNIPLEKINVNGGAIAMGHPLGATGAILVGTLLDELEARDLQRGMVTLCVGGGMGIATIIERV